MLLLSLLGSLLAVIIFVAILFAINPIFGILAFIWFVGVGINAWKRNK